MKHYWNRNGNLFPGFQISSWEDGFDAWSIFIFSSPAFETIIHCFVFTLSHLLDTTHIQGCWLPFLYCLALKLRVHVKLQLQSSHRGSTCVWVILLPSVSRVHFSNEMGIIHTAKSPATQNHAVWTKRPWTKGFIHSLWRSWQEQSYLLPFAQGTLGVSQEEQEKRHSFHGHVWPNTQP